MSRKNRGVLAKDKVECILMMQTFFEPKAKLEFGRSSFAFQGALVYNTLPRHFRNLNSRFLFKSNLKEFFSIVFHNSPLFSVL